MSLSSSIHNRSLPGLQIRGGLISTNRVSTRLSTKVELPRQVLHRTILDPARRMINHGNMCESCVLPGVLPPRASPKAAAVSNSDKPAGSLLIVLTCLLVLWVAVPDQMVLLAAVSLCLGAVVSFLLKHYVALRSPKPVKSPKQSTRRPRGTGRRQPLAPAQVARLEAAPAAAPAVPVCPAPASPVALNRQPSLPLAAAEPEKEQTISVRFLSGQSADVKVNADASVGELREKVGALRGTPAFRVKLLCGASLLKDEMRAGELEPAMDVMGVFVEGWQAVSASCDHTLRVWDIIAGTCSGELVGHTARVSAFRADFGCGRAVSASWDATLRVWDIKAMDCLGVLQGHTDSVSAVVADFAGDVAVSGAFDATIRVWDLNRFECLAALDGHLDRVVSIDAEFSLGRVLSRSNDGVLKVWNLPGGCRTTIDGHLGWLTATCGDLVQQRALTGAFDGSLKLWDLEDGALVGDLKGHDSGVNAVCADFALKQAVTGGMDGLRVWNLAELVCTAFLASRGEVIHALAVDFVGLRAVSGSAGGRVEVWDLAAKEQVAKHTGHGSLVNAIAADFARGRAVTCSTDGTLRAWDLATGPIGEGALTGHSRAVIALYAQ